MPITAVPLVVVMKSMVDVPFVVPMRLIWIAAWPRLVSSLIEYVGDEKLIALSSLMMVTTALAWLPMVGQPDGWGLDSLTLKVRSAFTIESSTTGILTD